MTNSMVQKIGALAAMAAPAGKQIGQKCTRTGSRALLLFVAAALVTVCPTDARAAGITIPELVTPPWQIAIVGNTGCGQASLLFTGYLSPNPSGKTGILKGSSGCGISSSAQTFTITSLSPDGTGTANLSCGSGCGWNFNIQVNNLWTFNLVDVANGSANVLAGTAMAQGGTTLPPYSLDDFAGTWTISLVGNTGCGRSSMWFVPTLNDSGTGTGFFGASSGPCGWSTNQTFTITDWNSNSNSGTATISCGSGCAWTFNIQLATDGWSFNLVDATDSGNELAGTAVRVAEGASLSPLQLAGVWQIALVGNTGCGQTSMEFIGNLNANGTTTGTLNSWSGCGFSSSTQTFTITPEGGSGAGTATLSCGSGCGWTFLIQVDGHELPQQTISLVDIENPGNTLAGTAIALYDSGS
jgi:hypothetical protein